MTPRFRAKIIDGKLSLYNRDAFAAYLHSISGEYYLYLERPKTKRTLQQNAYYFGVVIVESADAYGYAPWDRKYMHDAWKFRFLKVTDGKFERIKSTTELNTVEMSEYIEKIRAAALDDGHYIPDPSEVTIPNEFEAYA